MFECTSLCYLWCTKMKGMNQSQGASLLLIYLSMEDIEDDYMDRQREK